MSFFISGIEKKEMTAEQEIGIVFLCIILIILYLSTATKIVIIVYLIFGVYIFLVIKVC